MTSRAPLDWKISGLVLWSLVVVAQALLLRESAIIPVLLVIAGGVLGVLLSLRRDLFLRYPMSAMMVLGFSLFYFLLPPIATLLEGKPLTNNLVHPDLVFLHAVVCFGCLLLAHFAYRHSTLLQDFRWVIADRVYKPAGFFRAPSNPQLLIMGGIGLLATYIQVFMEGSVQRDLLGAGNKFLQALFVLAYLPLAILVREAMGKKGRVNRRWLCLVVAYVVVLLVISVARNSRTVFLQGLTSVAMVYVFAMAAGVIRARAISLKHVAFVLVGAALLLGPFTDLATSILVVRDDRAVLSAFELVTRTLEAYGDKEALEARRLAALEANSVWDERYVDNEFMSRLGNLKFADNSIDLARTLDRSKRQHLRSLEFQRMLSAFPRPVLRRFGLAVDKDLVGGASGGDLMLYTATGRSFVLGGFRAGSMLGSGYALFGWLYPVLLALVAPVLFALADALTSRVRRAGSRHPPFGWAPVLSPMAVIGFFAWSCYFTSAARGVESFSGLGYYILRGWLEVLLVYGLAYWVSYYVLRPFAKPHRPGGVVQRAAS